jgi:hypothetical protein
MVSAGLKRVGGNGYSVELKTIRNPLRPGVPVGVEKRAQMIQVGNIPSTILGSGQRSRVNAYYAFIQNMPPQTFVK